MILYSAIRNYISIFFDELPTRLFLMLFMFSNDPGYGNGAWYKSLGPKQKTDAELEDEMFSPNNYRQQNEQPITDAYEKMLELRKIPILPN